MSGAVKGSRLCGAVRYDVGGPLPDVVACHCGKYRKISGHFVAATSALRANLTIAGDVTWYGSSPGDLLTHQNQTGGPK